jgi:hypothetical protein
MAQNFIEGRREQGFLLPPDVREWLPADHLEASMSVKSSG